MDNTGNYPAFPCEAQGDRSVPREHDYLQTGIHTGKFPGVMIRDWFAAQALTAILARVFDADMEAEFIPSFTAARAYELADAMLAERSKS